MNENLPETRTDLEWYLQHDGRDVGPMSTEELCRLLAESGLGGRAMVRPAAWDQARPASMFPELEAATAAKDRAVPPPAPLTKSIVAVNGVVFALMVLGGVHILTPDTASLIRWGANFGPKTLGGEWWRLLTSTFLHIGIIHILFNMSVLWDVGRFMERQIGPLRLGVVYLFSGLLASLASLAWNSFTVSAGASGAVFGVYGSLVALLLRARGVSSAALRGLQRSAVTFLVFNLAFGLVVEGIDMAAHVGGLVAGCLFGLALIPRARPGTGSETKPDSRPVSPRWRPILPVTLAGALLVVAVAQALPRDAVEIQSVLEELQVVEKQVLEAYSELSAAAQEGRLTPEEMLVRLDRDVLTPWSEVEQKVRALDAEALPERLRTWRQGALEYLAAQKASWEELRGDLSSRVAGSGPGSGEDSGRPTGD